MPSRYSATSRARPNSGGATPSGVFNTPIRLARQLGLGLVQQIGLARRFFMKQAMGINGSSQRLL